MSIEEELRFLYDWSHPEFPMFGNCGTAFDGTQENVLCFLESFYKTINWQALKKYYSDHKEELEERLKKSKKNGSK